MITQIFAIRDEVANTYTTPFFQHNQAMAKRAFANMLENEQSQYGQNPTDYSLWHLGEYDDVSGHIDPAMPTDLIMQGTKA